MQIIDNVIIIALIVIAFIAGRKTSDSYYADIVSYLQFQLRLYAAEKGVGYVASPPQKKRVPIGQLFMDKLHEEGRATQALRSFPNKSGSDGASA